MSQMKSPPDCSWIELEGHGIFSRFGKWFRRDAPVETVTEIPESHEDYDLWQMLSNRAEVAVHTIDGMVIHIQKTPSSAVDRKAGSLSGLKFTIWDFGASRVYENVTCQQHCSAWKVIDPLRTGQAWRFRLREQAPDGTRLTYNGAVRVIWAY